jgi:hypothetical protein
MPTAPAAAVTLPGRNTAAQRYFYEKVIKVKADVAALLMFDFRYISTEKFALGSLRSDDWQLGRPTVSPLFVCLPVKPC